MCLFVLNMLLEVLIIVMQKCEIGWEALGRPGKYSPDGRDWPLSPHLFRRLPFIQYTCTSSRRGWPPLFHVPRDERMTTIGCCRILETQKAVLRHGILDGRMPPCTGQANPLSSPERLGRDSLLLWNVKHAHSAPRPPHHHPYSFCVGSSILSQV